MDDDWGDWDTLVEDVEEDIKDLVKENRNYAVKQFMEYVTRPAEYQGQQGFTPVDSGKLMANTVVSIGRVDDNVYDREDEDGQETLAIATMELATADPYVKVYIQNNTREGNEVYSLNADYKGWKKTPAYRFFTLSWYSAMNDVEDRE